MSPRLIFALLLAGATLTSALTVVWYQHQLRLAVKSLTALELRRDELNIEWRRLQLEIGANAAPARVERLAREGLGMISPPPKAIRNLPL